MTFIQLDWLSPLGILALAVPVFLAFWLNDDDLGKAIKISLVACFAVIAFVESLTRFSHNFAGVTL